MIAHGGKEEWTVALRVWLEPQVVVLSLGRSVRQRSMWSGEAEEGDPFSLGHAEHGASVGHLGGTHQTVGSIRLEPRRGSSHVGSRVRNLQMIFDAWKWTRPPRRTDHIHRAPTGVQIDSLIPDSHLAKVQPLARWRNHWSPRGVGWNGLWGH